MSDEELEHQYHEMRLRKLGNKTKVVRTVKRTDRLFFSRPCLHCGGTSRSPEEYTSYWYINTRYQDGNETSDGMTQEQALDEYFNNKDKSTMLTLIGPDGFVYVEDK